MIQKPKGTQDIYGDDGKELLYLESLLKSLMEKYNYEYFRIPIFESSELFHRGVGETTDIVSKETYDFQDRSFRNLTLRPEGTAGIVRSFLENKIYARNTLPVKTWYYGPMFRYERPQSGRYREFYQFGLEVFGSNDPLIDAEVISIVVNLYKLVGLDKLTVRINSLGDTLAREKYKEALKKHFEPHMESLCEDCQSRFSKNPLRILDCKVDNKLEIMKSAPKINDYLSLESKKHFELLKQYLKALGIDYVVDYNLVRGLDYYTDTVFEVEVDIEQLGSQNVLCGGGRYNNLVSNIGNIDVPGVGVAIGIERLMQVLKIKNITLDENKNIDLYIIPMIEEAKTKALNICQEVRMNGFKADMDYLNRNLKSNFKQADRLNANFVAIIGEDELAKDIITVKNNQTKEEYQVKDIIDFLDEKIGEDDD